MQHRGEKDANRAWRARARCWRGSPVVASPARMLQTPRSFCTGGGHCVRGPVYALKSMTADSYDPLLYCRMFQACTSVCASGLDWTVVMGRSNNMQWTQRCSTSSNMAKSFQESDTSSCSQRRAAHESESYRMNGARFAANSINSESRFHIQRGMTQSDALSSWLFNAGLEAATRRKPSLGPCAHCRIPVING